MIYCPKCGVSTEQVDSEGNAVLSCPSCCVVWSEFLELMANDDLWPDLVQRDKHDIICPKCGYERLTGDEAKSRTTCPDCRVSYAESLIAPAAAETQGRSEKFSTFDDEDGYAYGVQAASNISPSPNASMLGGPVTINSESSLAKKCGAAFGAMGTLQRWLTGVGAILTVGMVLEVIAKATKNANSETVGWIILLGSASFYVYKRLQSDFKEGKQKASNLAVPISDFTPTQEIMGTFRKTGLALDEVRNKLCLISVDGVVVSRRIVSYKDILSVELFENGTSVTKTSRSSQIVGAVVGDVLLGPVGLVVGALSGKTETTAIVNRIDLRLTINDTEAPLHDVSFDVLGIAGFSEEDQRAIARRWHGIISIIIKRAETEEQNLRAAERQTRLPLPSASIADELKKLSDLHNSGILTSDEFQQQKKRLLDGKQPEV